MVINSSNIHPTGFPAGPFWGGRLPPPPQKKKISYSSPKFVLTLFLFTLSPLPLGYSPPPKSFNSPPKGEILQETLNCDLEGSGGMRSSRKLFIHLIEHGVSFCILKYKSLSLTSFQTFAICIFYTFPVKSQLRRF